MCLFYKLRQSQYFVSPCAGRAFLLAIVCGLSSLFKVDPAHGFFFDMNMFYSNRSLTTSSSETTTDLFYDVSTGLDLTRKGDFTIGWSYTSLSQSTSGTSSSSVSSTEMGPMLGYFMDRNQTWSLSLAYHLVANVTYKPSSGTSQTWRGTTMKIGLGYAPQISESFYAGLKINYYLSSISESIIASSTYSTVSYANKWLFPSLYLSYRY